MGLTKKEAFEILELTPNADRQQIDLKYKQLALRWYPDMHDGNRVAVENFKKVSLAYKTLTDKSNSNNQNLSMEEMLTLFQHVFDVDDTDESDEGLASSSEEFCVNGSTSNKKKAEEAKQNADALIAEEEREKKRAEKKRAKKKKRKERKKQQKENCDKTSVIKTEEQNGERRCVRSEESDSSEIEEEDIDPNSAFVATALNKKRLANKLYPKKEVNKTNCNVVIHPNEDSQTIDDIDPIVIQSRELAKQGNVLANSGLYQEAVKKFTQAIKLDSTEHRFFGNRSYCYDRLAKFDKALKDAEKAIELSPTWPKGHFRKGRALAGLKKYSEAEASFQEVLKLDKDCEDAVQELLNVRIMQITEMGFSKHQAEVALKQQSTVQGAITMLLHSGATASFNCDTYFSEDEEKDFFNSVTSGHAFSTNNISDEKMNAKNPEGFTSLWVGNVKPEVTEKNLLPLFSKCGDLKSIRVLPDRHCAFVNYKTKLAAGKAMEMLQGKELNGSRLLIRFPDNPVTDKNLAVTVLKKPKPVAKPVDPKQKTTGPVNGDECYFWRTTGCVYGDRCRYKHVPGNRGIDKKPWFNEEDSKRV